MSAYTQDIIRLGEKWTLTPGVRYYHVDKSTYYSWMELGYTSMPAGWPFSVANSVKEETDSDFFPSLKVNYQLDQDTNTGYEKDWTYYLPATLPKHKVKMTADYEAIRDGWIQLSGRWVGSRGTQQSGGLDDYAVCDLGFKKKFKWDHQKFELNLFVNNVTGTRYEEVAGYPMPRYVWGMSLAVEF